MFLHCGTNDAARSVSALGALEDSYEAAHSVFESSVSALARSDATVADGTCAALADGSAALELANPENHDEVHDGTAEFVAPIVSHVVHSLPLQTEEVVRNAQENATETLADGGSDDSDLAGTTASHRQPECSDGHPKPDTQAWQAHPTCNREHATCNVLHASCNVPDATYSMHMQQTAWNTHAMRCIATVPRSMHAARNIEQGARQIRRRYNATASCATHATVFATLTALWHCTALPLCQ